MSVRCISKVLEESGHAGTELLMLVVLADYSDDDGNSYPAVASLARKCRMSSRNANYILSALQASGELRVLKNEGPKGTNRYRIMLSALGRNLPLKPASPLTRMSPVTQVSSLKPTSSPTPEAGFTPERDCTLKPTSSTPEAGFLKPLKPTSDEPSLNRQEPSYTSKLPLCPHDTVVDLYHEVLPEMSRVRLMDPKRKTVIKTFWTWVLQSRKTDGTRRAETADQALQWIRGYFERTRSNDFLMGRTARSEAHSNWKCDLDYLLTERGRKQVIEKTEEAHS